ncbi:hypothetical protein RHGRI_023536 [Rhododendron griersonianum]|uniref:Uncharacterized protein n=1 Tax=Rhododendron griersonianum TaxID=479676 RepID=A0AAV6J455_9ERIC|nr:hypothetical protein RHGRI_023536 [Rhododendron griersonianum]
MWTPPARILLFRQNGSFQSALPGPVIPDLELPYTEEECQPSPLEDEKDEEMVDGAIAKDQREFGGNATEGGGRDRSAKVEVQDKVAEDESHVKID